MADAVTSQTIQDGVKNVVMKFTNISDGTGVTIEKIWWQCIGMKVSIFFDATSNVFVMQLGENQSGHHDYSAFGGLPNNAGSGKTGDILFTTVGHSSADTYTIILSMRKNYG